VLGFYVFSIETGTNIFRYPQSRSFLMLLLYIDLWSALVGLSVPLLTPIAKTMMYIHYQRQIQHHREERVSLSTVIENTFDRLGHYDLLTTTPLQHHSPNFRIIKQIPDEICCICHSEFDANSVQSVHCGHIFHDQCVTEWILSRYHAPCPICKRDFSSSPLPGLEIPMVVQVTTPSPM
jgi:hypothetical protein